MTKIKICGITRKEDIEYLNELKPDYAGFVFAKSRRRVTLEKAKELISLLDKKIKPVGVFQNENINIVKQFAKDLNLEIIQLHGEENESYLDELCKFKVWKACSVDVDNGELKGSINSTAEGILLDSCKGNAAGGTGICFNWDIIKSLNIDKKLILAGGLNPKNVRSAIDIVNPFAVDVSSGVETNGVKNYKKIKKFIDKVRENI
ncbi:MAG: phosphoribosylanthranilate isomerase [Solirubrobacterales bacterium]